MKSKVAFQNFKNEQELESWIAKTANAFSHQQIASITGFPYIKEAVKKASEAIT